MSYIPQYSQQSNAQMLAAQQTLNAQQKQALMFRGGGYTAPDMGGNNPDTQVLANSLAKNIANQQTQAINDQRAFVGGRHIRHRIHKKGGKTIRRIKRTHMKKRNKRITKRKYYTKR
jgi:hypothetical protein